MITGILFNIHWLIKANVSLAGEFSDSFVFYLSGFGKNTFSKRMSTNWLGFKCPNYVRLDCNKRHCKTLGMVSENRKDKIKSVRDSLNKV